ncbi:MAG: hypothetical protein KKD39_00440 [Candidatus Altiarchaeota archaeon]|nr:hypothetical protein [Candidatus Altiarchaeota archaeon]
MKTFKIEEEGIGTVEYCILRCDVCKNIMRHDIRLGSFGRMMKNRMCIVCGEKIPLDEMHCLDTDPMAGTHTAEFKSAKDL